MLKICKCALTNLTLVLSISDEIDTLSAGKDHEKIKRGSETNEQNYEELLSNLTSCLQRFAPQMRENDVGPSDHRVTPGFPATPIARSPSHFR